MDIGYLIDATLLAGVVVVVWVAARPLLSWVDELRKQRARGVRRRRSSRRRGPGGTD